MRGKTYLFKKLDAKGNGRVIGPRSADTEATLLAARLPSSGSRSTSRLSSSGDVRNLLRVADLPEFNRFLRACALIEPYFGNRTKRLIKAPIHCSRTAGGPEADLVVERSAGALIAIECKWKEHPCASDAAGLRALGATEGRRVNEKMIVCRTKATCRLVDGTWVLGVGDALRYLEAAR